MKKLFFFFIIFILGSFLMTLTLQDFEEDIFDTSQGQLKITFIGHGTLMFTFEEKIIHVDPVKHPLPLPLRKYRHLRACGIAQGGKRYRGAHPEYEITSNRSNRIFWLQKTPLSLRYRYALNL